MAGDNQSVLTDPEKYNIIQASESDFFDAAADREFILRETQKIAQFGTYDFNIERGSWSSSAKLDSIFGISPEYDRSFQGWLDIIHPDWRQQISDYVQHHVIGQLQTFDREYRIIRIDDRRERWLHGLGKLVINPSGIPVRLIGTIVDITERKRSEEALKLSESNLQALINNKKESIWSLDTGYRLIICNDYFTTAFFAAYQVELKVGLNLVEQLSPLQQTIWKPKYDAALSGEKITFEFSETIQGARYYFDVYLNPIYTEGIITGVSAMSIDITERKKAEAAMLESQENLNRQRNELAAERTLLRTLVDLLPAYVFVKDLESRFLLANVACAKYMGATTPKDLIGKTDTDFFPNEMAESFLDEEQEVLKGMPFYNKEEVRFMPARIQHNLLTTKVPLRDAGGSIVGLVGASIDITEIRQAEIFQQIQYNIAREVVLAGSLEKVVWAVRNELNRLLDTTNFFVALNLSETGNLRKVVFIDEKDEFVEWKVEGSFSGQVVRQAKTLLLKKEEIGRFAEENNLILQGTIPECWLGVPLIINQQVIGVMVIQNYDNPEAYNQASASLLELMSRELSLFIDRRKMMDDLVVAKERAQESDRLKSAFLANMSHEIRTPLNSIIGFSELIVEVATDPEEVVRYTEIIRGNGDRLLQLINNLIDISKIESGTQPVRITRVTPASMIQEVAGQFRLMAQKKSIEIRTRIPSKWKDPMIRTDSLKLHQILSNLLNNALKYTNEGFIEVGFERHPEGALFYVRDTGIGIPGENLDRVFDRFYQIDLSYSRQFEGAGLGLSLCKGMVELLGGRIWAESQVGQGSTFWFTVRDCRDA